MIGVIGTESGEQQVVISDGAVVEQDVTVTTVVSRGGMNDAVTGKQTVVVSSSVQLEVVVGTGRFIPMRVTVLVVQVRASGSERPSEGVGVIIAGSESKVADPNPSSTPRTSVCEVKR